MQIVCAKLSFTIISIDFLEPYNMYWYNLLKAFSIFPIFFHSSKVRSSCFPCILEESREFFLMLFCTWAAFSCPQETL